MASITGAAVGAIGQTGATLLNPIFTLWNAFLNILPGIIWAIILLLFGYILAAVLGHALKLALEKFGIDSWVKKAKLTKAVGTTHVSGVLGEILKWYVFLIFLGAAVDKLELGTLSVLLEKLVLWLPNVIAAILVMLVGLFLAYFIEMKVVEKSSMKGIKLAASTLRWVIIIIAVIIALGQIGIEVNLLENAILLIIGALAVGFALAFGISFGLGFKKEAEDIVKDVKRNL